MNSVWFCRTDANNIKSAIAIMHCTLALRSKSYRDALDACIDVQMQACITIVFFDCINRYGILFVTIKRVSDH